MDRHRGVSTEQKFKDLDALIDVINIDTNAPVTVDALIRQTEIPFTERMMRDRVSSRFKLSPQLGVYLGQTDPMDPLDSYKRCSRGFGRGNVQSFLSDLN